MQVAVFGSGYVGLVTGTCLADVGNHVTLVDIDIAKVQRLSAGECSIFEPGLAEMMQANLQAARLRFTTDAHAAIARADVLFIAVGTPPRPDGSANLSAVQAVARTVAQHADRPKILAIKSTVPVGTGRMVEAIVREHATVPIEVISNPEFLKEGSAVEDFVRPDRVVVGTSSEQAAGVFRELYAPFVRNNHPILVMSREASEMTKYAANCLLACRISFINEIANLCERAGVDIDEVRQGIGTDGRIGFSFLYPGVGYGGSCFPKDVQALAAVGEALGFDAALLRTTHEVNERQRLRICERITEHFSANLAGRTIAIWGAAFKPKTDDIREAPAMLTAEKLIAQGAAVRLHDPKALANVERDYAADIAAGRLLCLKDQYEALQGADVLAVMTEWNDYRSPDFDRIRKALQQPVIFDGRNVFTPAQMQRLGFTYYSIGRPPLLPAS